MSKEITCKPESMGGQLTVIPPEDKVSAFYGDSALDLGISAADFDVFEEIQSIIGLIRHPNPQVKAVGHRLFRTVLREVATARGILGRVAETHVGKQGDEEVRRVVSADAILTRLSKDKNREDPNKDGQHLEHHRAGSIPRSGGSLETSPGGEAPRADEDGGPHPDRPDGDEGPRGNVEEEPGGTELRDRG